MPSADLRMCFFLYYQVVKQISTTYEMGALHHVQPVISSKGHSDNILTMLSALLDTVSDLLTF